MKNRKEKHESHPVVNLGTRDLFALIVFLVAIVSAVAAFFLYYDKMWIFLMPFVFVGAVNYLLRGHYFQFIMAVAQSLLTWQLCSFVFNTEGHMRLFLVMLIVFGIFGLASIVDTCERAIFYPVLRRIRFVNSAGATFGTRLVALVFDVREDTDARDITVNLDVRERTFPRGEVLSVALSALVFCVIYWIQMVIGGYEPAVNDSFPFVSLETFLNMATVSSYALFFTMPFVIFRVMDAKVRKTKTRSVHLYNGFLSTMQHMVLALLFLLAISIAMFIPKGMLWPALAVVLLSTVVTLVLTAVTCSTEFYTMEVSTVSELAKRWKAFMPVSLFEDYREDSGLDGSATAPLRDTSDFTQIPFDVGRKHQ